MSDEADDDIDIDAPLPDTTEEVEPAEAEAETEVEASAPAAQENAYEAVARKYNNLTPEQTETVMLAGLRALQGGQAQPAVVNAPATETLPDPDAPMTWGEATKFQQRVIAEAQKQAMDNVQRQLDFQNLQNEIDALPMVQGDPRARKTLLTAALQERAENPYASAKSIVNGVVQTVAQMGSRIVQPKPAAKVAKAPAAPAKKVAKTAEPATDRGVFDTTKVVSIGEDFDRRMSNKNARVLAEMRATQRLK